MLTIGYQHTPDGEKVVINGTVVEKSNAYELEGRLFVTLEDPHWVAELLKHPLKKIGLFVGRLTICPPEGWKKPVHAVEFQFPSKHGTPVIRALLEGDAGATDDYAAALVKMPAAQAGTLSLFRGGAMDTSWGLTVPVTVDGGTAGQEIERFRDEVNELVLAVERKAPK